MADWTQIASGEGAEGQALNLDLDNNRYLFVFEFPVDVPPFIPGAVQNGLAFLGLPVQVELSGPHELRIEVG